MCCSSTLFFGGFDNSHSKPRLDIRTLDWGQPFPASSFRGLPLLRSCKTSPPKRTPPRDRKWSNKKSTLKDEATCLAKFVRPFFFSNIIDILMIYLFLKKGWWTKIPRRSSGWKFAKWKRIMDAACVMCHAEQLIFDFPPKINSPSRQQSAYCLVVRKESAERRLEDPTGYLVSWGLHHAISN